jgi:glycosyltransferase involved in cell wall biosynthesis
MRWMMSFVFFLFMQIRAEETKICLNMIVKNESRVIRRCLESVKPLIDYYVIVDTGSTDGTQNIIREVMASIPGELHEAEWKNFGFNRNIALDHAKGKGDYLLFIDADEEFIYDPDFDLKHLTLDSYHIVVKNEVQGSITSEYTRRLLVNNHLDWRWQGVIHEDIYCERENQTALLNGIYNISRTTEGARSRDPNKYLNDAKILEEELLKDPQNSRNLVHLGLSYDLAGQSQNALDAFCRAIEIGIHRPHFSAEIDVALLIRTELLIKLGYNDEKIFESAQMSYLYNQNRAEPLFFLGSHLMNRGFWVLAELVLKKAKTIPKPCLVGFVLNNVYDWEIEYSLIQCCYNLQKYGEVLQLMDELLQKGGIPEWVELDILEHRNYMVSNVM